MQLTPRQNEIFEFLVSYLRDVGYAPTIAEIQEYFKLNSSASVHQKLTELEREGLIRRHKNVHRGIEILQWPTDGEAQGAISATPEKDELEIPLLGYVVAGKPIEACLIPENVFVPRDLYSGARFALKVKGDSMRDEQIASGDYIVVDPNNGRRPRNGQTVVALIDESEATVKKFYDERTQIRLQPANDEFEPIVVKPTQRVKIQGVVVGLIRKFK